MASGKFQTLLYKEEIEAFMRTPGLGRGSSSWISTISRGKGTALVGVLDAFWGSKGYVEPGGVQAFLRGDGAPGPDEEALLDRERDVPRIA